ncbi:hypothetical protein D3C75_1060940 [compost metagenome]
MLSPVINVLGVEKLAPVTPKIFEVSSAISIPTFVAAVEFVPPAATESKFALDVTD